MSTNEFKAAPYTIEIAWETGEVWLNNHATKEKLVVTEKDSASIASAFKLIEAKKSGRF